MKKTVLFTKIFVVTLSLGLMWGCQSTAVGPQYGISEGKPASAIWIQGKDCDHAQTTATSERAGSRQGFYRHIRRKIVLRISDCDQGPDPGWQPSPVRCLQTGACGIWTDDEPRFCGGNARAPSHSRSAIRWVRSPRGLIGEFWRSAGCQSANDCFGSAGVICNR